MMNNETLLSCPFCGRDNVEVHDATEILGVWRLVHRCKVIGTVSLESYDKERIVREWNTRAPVVMPEGVEEALKHCLAVFSSMADRGRYPLELIAPGHYEYDPSVYLGKQGWAFLTDAIDSLRSLPSPSPTSSEYLQFTPDQTSSPAPVEGLPAGCPETAFFDPMDGQIHSDEKSGEEVVVEIHPVGTRARLSRLERDNKENS